MGSNNLTFSEKWEFFPCNIEDQSFSVRFDTAVEQLDEDARAQYPHMIELLIPFIEAKENGFPAQAEMERINQIEDDFSCGAYPVRLIGILTGGHCSRFVFCCNGTDEDIENMIQTLMGENQNIEFSHRAFLDDNFGYYENMIAPSLYDKNWIMDRQVCDNLSRDGEAFHEPRDVDFFCYFGSAQYIEKISDTLCGQGFREVIRQERDGGEYLLHLSLEGIPSLPWINEITSGILDLLEGTDGYFDGWGSPVIR
jgi:hypothetical protein